MMTLEGEPRGSRGPADPQVEEGLQGLSPRSSVADEEDDAGQQAAVRPASAPGHATHASHASLQNLVRLNCPCSIRAQVSCATVLRAAFGWSRSARAAMICVGSDCGAVWAGTVRCSRACHACLPCQPAEPGAPTQAHCQLQGANCLSLVHMQAKLVAWALCSPMCREAASGEQLMSPAMHRAVQPDFHYHSHMMALLPMHSQLRVGGGA